MKFKHLRLFVEKTQFLFIDLHCHICQKSIDCEQILNPVGCYCVITKHFDVCASNQVAFSFSKWFLYFKCMLVWDYQFLHKSLLQYCWHYSILLQHPLQANTPADSIQTPSFCYLDLYFLSAIIWSFWCLNLYYIFYRIYSEVCWLWC